MLFTLSISNRAKPYDAKIAADIAQRFSVLGKELADFLGAVGSASPYLRHLLNTQGGWLLNHADHPLPQVLKRIMVIDDAVGIALRRAKQRVALCTALADLAGIADLQTITAALSDFADWAIEQALRDAIAQADLPANRFGKDGFGGIFCLGMGKLGAQELNYSSDIDLIFFFDDQTHPAAQIGTLRAAFSKIVRKTCQTLSAQNEYGYVFRTDLRLRPNPSVTPVCQSVHAAHNYYHQEGRSWERAAFIKARVCAGDRRAGQAFLAMQQPFIWRQVLDFAAMNEVSALLEQTRDYRQIGEAIDGYDLKLGRGGIREIEFFTQTRQLIFGGRNPALRMGGTCDALHALACADQIETETARNLMAYYTKLRDLEHRVQMLRDQQTHNLPSNQDDYDRLLALMGHCDGKAFETMLRAQIEHTIALCQPADNTTAYSPAVVVEFDDFDLLPALRHDKAKALFRKLQPTLSVMIKAAPNPQEAKQSLRHYIGALREGVAPLSLFHARPDVLGDLFHLLYLSKPLSIELAQHMSQVYDLVERGARNDMPSQAQYDALLGERLENHTDYEAQLTAMRAWAGEQKFQIKFAQLRYNLSIERAEQAYSAIAQSCLRYVLPLLQDQMQMKYGILAGAKVAIVAMGKLGSTEMTATSDLDLIVIYDADKNAISDSKGLDAKQYFTQFTRMLITALSAQMAHGFLYNVDMRLRPSGRAGMVATQIESFAQYQYQKAWVWEHQALSRARVVVGDGGLCAAVNKVRAEVIDNFHSRDYLVQEARAMRKRLAADYGAGQQSALAVKKGLGGMLDVELLAQNYTLIGASQSRRPIAQLADAYKAGLIEPALYNSLDEHYTRFKLVDHYLRQLGLDARDEMALNDAAKALLEQRSGLSFGDLLKQLDDGRAIMADGVDKALDEFNP